jgi:glycosyltransferase involved in cell wall biosynthesis
MGHPNEERYRGEARRLGIERSVTLTGRIPYQETARYLALGDVGVSPKHASTEANGKLLHYMACGLPAVAYDGPVSRDLLGDAGIFVPLRDVEGLAGACAAILRNPQEQKDRGQALRERALAGFAWSALGKRLVDVYRDCLRER